MNKLILVVAFVCHAIISIAQYVPERTQKWTSFRQIKDASFLKKKVKFKVSASVKIHSNDPKASASVGAVVYRKGGGQKYFLVDIPKDSTRNGIDSWNTYTAEGEMDETTDKIHIASYCSNQGKFYFDNFELSVQNDKGVYEKVPLENADFESKVMDNKIPNWIEAYAPNRPLRIKGYEFSSSEDHAHGNYSLLLEGKNLAIDSSNFIFPTKGYSPQIGSLVMMLNNLSSRVEERVASLTQKELDELMDEKANSIGALIMHLAAAEKFYQLVTFEGRMFNEEEKNPWKVAFDLGEEARQMFKGHNIHYYMDIYKQVRKHTLEELSKRDDEWLLKNVLGRGLERNNYYCWFHVMEHQSSHLGQILLLIKRLPEKQDITEPKIDLKH
ncbi:MAG: DinB family protein [Bacteroidetes bacterium]|nr:DinB family protein [Bacteroidota bacterium]